MTRPAIKPHGGRTALILTGLICSLLLGFARPAPAEDAKFRIADVRAALDGSAERDQTGVPASHDAAELALANFARQIQATANGGETTRPSESRPSANHDEAYSALLAFAEQVQAEAAPPPSVGASAPASHGVAGRDDELSALKEFAQQLGPKLPKLRVAVDKPAGSAKAEAEEATNVGPQVCMRCHVVQAAAFGVTLMGKIFRNPRNVQEKANCETCHGPGSLHVKAGGGRGVGGIISFRLDDPAQNVESLNAICLSCHEKGNRTLWRGSAHETRGIACVNCHTVMTNVTPKHQLSMLTEADTCFQCHKNKRSEVWRTSHMPVREGKITCSTCHNPHGSYSESLLKTATINDTCYKCHAEKRGPFLWEHPPVRENCLNCHDAHGSINDSMLKVSRPRLCQQCHTAADHPGNPGSGISMYSFNRSCSNCHVKIHGSNSPAGSQLVR
jgi:DmsE family decaheme c-type cytochrome